MKIIEIKDDLVEQVAIALAKRAQYFEGAIEANGYGNLRGDAETVASWRRAANDLWALVRSLGKQPTIFSEEPLKIIEVQTSFAGVIKNGALVADVKGQEFTAVNCSLAKPKS